MPGSETRRGRQGRANSDPVPEEDFTVLDLRLGVDRPPDLLMPDADRFRGLLDRPLVRTLEGRPPALEVMPSAGSVNLTPYEDQLAICPASTTDRKAAGRRGCDRGRPAGRRPAGRRAGFPHGRGCWCMHSRPRAPAPVRWFSRSCRPGRLRGRWRGSPACPWPCRTTPGACPTPGRSRVGSCGPAMSSSCLWPGPPSIPADR